MIELQYNADGKLEYRTRILGYIADKPLGVLDGWNDWKIVPSVEKEVETPTDSSWRTERVTLDVTHCGIASASKWLWKDAMAEFCPTKAWEIESVRVVDTTAEAMQQSAAWDGAREAYSEGIARVKAERDEFRECALGRAECLAKVMREREEAESERNKLKARVAELERDRRPATWQEEEAAVEGAWLLCGLEPDWPSDEPGTIVRHAESMRREVGRLRARVAELEAERDAAKEECGRLRHLLKTKESECETHHPWVHPVDAANDDKLCESMDRVLREWIKAFNILAKIMPGIPVDEDDPVGTAAKIDEAIRQQITNMGVLIESYARDNRPHNWMHQEMYRLGFGDIKSGMNADCVDMLSEKYEQVKNERDKYVEAFGLLTTLCPHLEINYDDPMGMAKTILQMRNMFYIGKPQTTGMESVHTREYLCTTLTEAEQKAIEYAYGLIKYWAEGADRRYDHKTYYHDHRDALAGLLDRSSKDKK